MDSACIEASLEEVRAVQDSLPRLEREVMSTLTEDGVRVPLPARSSNTSGKWFIERAAEGEQNGCLQAGLVQRDARLPHRPGHPS